MTESCRLVTTEQYQEYLKLKEEHKPLSWKELKEEAKKMGAEIMVDYQGVEFIRFRGICFRKDGAVDSGFKYGDIAINRKIEQMLAIMKALQ